VIFKQFNRLEDFESKLFDILRALSSFFVLLGHTYQSLILPRVEVSPIITKVIFALAEYSVMVFFALSGYMITLSIYKNVSDSYFTSFNANKFFKDRLIRLYPPLILSTLIAVIVYFLSHELGLELLDHNGKKIVELGVGIHASLFFLQNLFVDLFPTPLMNSPLWSLSHEFWFYVIGMLSVLVIVNKKGVALLCLLVLVLTLIILGKWQPFFLGFLVWLMGGGLAILRQNRTKIGKKGFFCLSVLLLVSLILWSLFFTKIFNLDWFEAKYIFGFCFILSLTMFLYYQGRFLNQLICNNQLFLFLQKSASYSYTLYLIHWPLLIFIHSIFLAMGLSSGAYIAIEVLLSLFLILKTAKVCSCFVENKVWILGLLSSVNRLFLKKGINNESV